MYYSVRIRSLPSAYEAVCPTFDLTARNPSLVAVKRHIKMSIFDAIHANMRLLQPIPDNVDLDDADTIQLDFSVRQRLKIDLYRRLRMIHYRAGSFKLLEERSGLDLARLLNLKISTPMLRLEQAFGSLGLKLELQAVPAHRHHRTIKEPV